MSVATKSDKCRASHARGIGVYANEQRQIRGVVERLSQTVHNALEMVEQLNKNVKLIEITAIQADERSKRVQRNLQKLNKDSE